MILVADGDRCAGRTRLHGTQGQEPVLDLDDAVIEPSLSALEPPTSLVIGPHDVRVSVPQRCPQGAKAIQRDQRTEVPRAGEVASSGNGDADDQAHE